MSNNSTDEVCLTTWLHISDLHCVSTGAYANHLSLLLHGNRQNGHSDSIETGGIEFVLRELGCIGNIVITGDILNKGSSEHLDDIKSEIEEIFNLCEEVNYKSSETPSLSLKILYCPGNHDLSRDEKSGTLTRENLLTLRKQNNFWDELDTSKFDKDMAYDLLTKKSFKKFFELFASLQQKAKVWNDSKEYNLHLLEVNKNAAVVFCGINTALIAGQKRQKNDDDELECLEQLYVIAKSERKNGLLNNGKYSTAKKHYNSTHLIDDKGKLCFISPQAQKDLKERFKNLKKRYKNIVTIFYGHHPLEWLDASAREYAVRLMRDCNCYLYLCGHTHVPSPQTSPIENSNIHQICIGALKREEKDNEAFGSFSIGKIIVKHKEIKAKITKWQYVPSTFGKSWTHYSETIELGLYIESAETLENCENEPKLPSHIEAQNGRGISRFLDLFKADQKLSDNEKITQGTQQR